MNITKIKQKIDDKEKLIQSHQKQLRVWRKDLELAELREEVAKLKKKG